jgi:hypothetical protein
MFRSILYNSMETRICKKCNQERPITDFEIRTDRKSGIRRHRCCDCEKKRKQADYNKNKNKYLIRASQQRKKERKEIRLLLDKHKNVPCCDCGKIFPTYCMDFDHVEKKTISITDLQRYRANKTTILKELEKCEVVCAICHRIRTHNRNQYIKATNSD